MAEGFPPAVAVILFQDAATPISDEAWAKARSTLCAWAYRGCAHVVRNEIPLDMATLASVSEEDIAGARLVVFHPHVALAFPPTVVVWK